MPHSTKRRMCGICVDEYSVRLSPRSSAIEQRGSIAPPAVRCCTTSRSTTTSASAKPAATSPPPTDHSCVLLVPNCSQTSGAPGSSAFSGSITAGFDSYSTTTASAASTTAYLSLPTTTATGSPPCFTSPRLSGQCSGVLIGTPGGAQTSGIGPAKSGDRSSPVKAATTPLCSSAADVSTETIVACASGERTIAA